jgi:alpha-tubulin suppressor-like RCC1 family protein
LWIWGSASDGKLGTNDITPDRSIPVTTFAGGNNWKQVVCDRVNTAAIKTDGTLWNWGDGYSGRLGNGVTTDVSTPVTTFAGGTNWKQVEVGGFHSAAVTYEDPVI